MATDITVIPDLPPPPPPPPPQSHQPTIKTGGKYQDLDGSGKILLQTKANKANMTPLQEVHYAIKKLPKWRKEVDLDEESKSAWLAVNSYVSPLIQEGPTCGLVVIKLAGSLLGGEEIEVDRLFQEAKKKRYTLQGEMFSVDNMLALATATLKCTGKLILGGLHSHRRDILTSMQRQRPVLVPYDEDFNHEPCSRGGHRAHWCLLTGFLIRVPYATVGERQIKDFGFTPDPSCSNLFISSSPLEDDFIDSLSPGADDLYVFTRQGKSNHLGLWSFSSLAESNDNLKEFSPSRDDGEYLLPEGGVEGGLCGKAVILQSLEE